MMAPFGANLRPGDAYSVLDQLSARTATLELETATLDSRMKLCVQTVGHRGSIVVWASETSDGFVPHNVRRYDVPRSTASQSTRQSLETCRSELITLKRVWDAASLVSHTEAAWHATRWEDLEANVVETTCRRLLR